jgi:RNA recognition motif-containing protein
MSIYVGNLPYQASEEELNELFSQYGEVTSVNIIQDRETGRSKGFGFIEMNDKSNAATAIENLDGAVFMGRNLRVNEARPRTERPPRRDY